MLKSHESNDTIYHKNEMLINYNTKIPHLIYENIPIGF